MRFLKKMVLTIISSAFLIHPLFAYAHQSPYQKYKNDQNIDEIPPKHLLEHRYPVNPAPLLDQEDSHLQILSWDGKVPLRRIIEAIKEGETDQIQILKLFSGPNIITRAPNDQEVWVYHWLWSYSKEYDPNKAMIYIDKTGKRLRKNLKPVSLVIAFDENDIVESYAVKFIKPGKDDFHAY